MRDSAIILILLILFLLVCVMPNGFPCGFALTDFNGFAKQRELPFWFPVTAMQGVLLSFAQRALFSAPGNQRHLNRLPHFFSNALPAACMRVVPRHVSCPSGCKHGLLTYLHFCFLPQHRSRFVPLSEDVYPPVISRPTLTLGKSREEAFLFCAQA